MVQIILDRNNNQDEVTKPREDIEREHVRSVVSEMSPESLSMV